MQRARSYDGGWPVPAARSDPTTAAGEPRIRMHPKLGRVTLPSAIQLFGDPSGEIDQG
jgi:hypothetical protein